MSKYFCPCCNYSTNKKQSYDSHNLSNRHNKILKNNQENNNQENTKEDIKEYKCINCNKLYLTQGGLWKHNRFCKKEKEKDDIPEYVKALITQNTDLVNKIIELSKNQQPIITNNNITNMPITNNTINIFLNDACKDAINMSDFIKKIEIAVDDVSKIADCGYIEAVNEVIINELQKYKITERPIHNIKSLNNNITHIKENDIWNIGKPEEIEKIATNVETKMKETYNEELKKIDTKEENPYFRIKLIKIKKNLINIDEDNKLTKVIKSVTLKKNEVLENIKQ